MQEVDLGRVLQHLHRQVRGRAVAGRRVVELARLALRERDEFGQRLRRDLRIDHQQVRRDRDQRDRREVLDRIVGQLRVGARRDGVRARRADGQRVAVRRRLGRGVGADGAAGAAAFSTTTCCPRRSLSFCATIRPTMSVEPPGGKPMISRIGLLG